MPFVETARCDGRCCRDFIIPAVHSVGGFEAWKAMVADPDALRRFADAEYIVDMLIIKDGKVEVCPLSGSKLDEPQEHFGCRHWDEATGDCTAYAARPSMCADWPYDDDGVLFLREGACAMEGCTRRAQWVNDADVLKAELTHDAP